MNFAWRLTEFLLRDDADRLLLELGDLLAQLVLLALARRAARFELAGLDLDQLGDCRLVGAGQHVFGKDQLLEPVRSACRRVLRTAISSRPLE